MNFSLKGLAALGLGFLAPCVLTPVLAQSSSDTYGRSYQEDEQRQSSRGQSYGQRQDYGDYGRSQSSTGQRQRSRSQAQGHQGAHYGRDDGSGAEGETYGQRQGYDRSGEGYSDDEHRWQNSQGHSSLRRSRSNEDYGQSADEHFQRISGKVLKTKHVEVRHADVDVLVALVQTNQGRQVIVDLGPVDELSEHKVGVRKGASITAWGQFERVGPHRGLVASNLRAGSRSMDIERSWIAGSEQARQEARQLESSDHQSNQDEE